MTNTKDKILKIILNEAPNATSEYYEEKYEITPKNFFEYAKKDFEMENEKGFTNAANNIRIGIECQIDTILTIFDFLKKSKTDNWNYETKVEFLEKLNITSQKTIKRVLKLKNLVGTEYKLNSKKTIESALKTFEAFLSETQKCIKQLNEFQFDVSAHPEFNENSSQDWVFELKYKNNEFFIYYLNKEILKLTQDDEKYFDFLKKYVEYWQNI